MTQNKKFSKNDILDAVVSGGKKLAGQVTDQAKHSYESIKQGSIQQSMLDAMKSSAIALARTTAEIDANLRDSDSPYEVAFYRVSGNLTVIGGITFDIHFSKTADSKRRDEFVEVISPTTNKLLKISRSALVGKKFIQVRDPETKEIFTYDIDKKIITMDSKAEKVDDHCDDFVKVASPITNKVLKIPKSALVDKKFVQVRDPETKEIFTYDIENKIITKD